MQAATGLHRWGLERVEVMFGKVVVLRLDVAITFDIVRNKKTGKLFVFLGREDGDVILRPHQGS